MFASLQVADVGLLKSFRVRPPSPDAVPGLRDARSGLMARFTESLTPDPAFGRAMWLGFWDDEAAFERFNESGSALLDTFDGGWTLGMTPLKAHGSWPGFPTDLGADGDEGGPVVVMTLGLLRMRRALAWTRASNRVQRQFLETSGVVWAMGASKPPFFAATVSVWESAADAAGFAHRQGEAHAAAAKENAADPFMRQEIFARFKPVWSEGSLGPNPDLAEGWLTGRTAA